MLIPVNELTRAKGRLAAVLAPEERARLVLATVRTVVEAVRGAGLEPVLLTRDARIKAEFEGVATLMDEDPAVHGLNAQVETAIARLGPGAEEVLILHADLPLASAEAIGRLVADASPAPSVALVESADGGTNGMLLRPPGRFALAYGRESFALHESAARAAGMTVRRCEIAELALDLDTPADVERLLAVPGGPESAAGRVLRSGTGASGALG